MYLWIYEWHFLVGRKDATMSSPEICRITLYVLFELQIQYSQRNLSPLQNEWHLPFWFISLKKMGGIFWLYWIIVHHFVQRITIIVFAVAILLDVHKLMYKVKEVWVVIHIWNGCCETCWMRLGFLPLLDIDSILFIHLFFKKKFLVIKTKSIFKNHTIIISNCNMINKKRTICFKKTKL